MRLELVYGFRADRAGQVPALFDSHWQHPSPIDAAGYWHPYGGARTARSIFVGVRAGRWENENEEMSQTWSALVKAHRACRDQVAEFEAWWYHADRSAHREAAHNPLLTWHVVVSHDL